MIGRPVWAFQTRAVPSWLAVTTRPPSGLNSAWKTHRPCLSAAPIVAPVVNIPDPRGPVLAGRDQTPAVRAEGTIPDRAAMRELAEAPEALRP